MTRQAANNNYVAKKIAAELAWKAVRTNKNLALDNELRQTANDADLDLKQAYALRTRYAPSI